MSPVHLLSVLFWASCCCLLAAVDDPDPVKVLNEAQALRVQGKYEEALQKHLWFHENALKSNPAMSGVRLSFALSYWVELGEMYPKAREALIAIRDKNVKTISEGGGTFELFHDVSSINGYLEQRPSTVELFKRLQQKQPDLAKLCYQVAEPDLVKSREYQVCGRFLPDPLESLERMKEMRAMNLKLADQGLPDLKNYADTSFVERACRIIEILVGANRKPEAEKFREKALAVHDDPSIRQAVEKAIERQNQKTLGQ